MRHGAAEACAVSTSRSEQNGRSCCAPQRTASSIPAAGSVGAPAAPAVPQVLIRPAARRRGRPRLARCRCHCPFQANSARAAYRPLVRRRRWRCPSAAPLTSTEHALRCSLQHRLAVLGPGLQQAIEAPVGINVLQELPPSRCRPRDRAARAVAPRQNLTTGLRCGPAVVYEIAGENIPFGRGEAMIARSSGEMPIAAETTRSLIALRSVNLASLVRPAIKVIQSRIRSSVYVRPK